MKLTLVLGTNNSHKRKELALLLKDIKVRVISLAHFKRVPRVVENGKTFKANAIKKARAFSRLSHFLTLADDSGLCVAALNRAPGVYSARYAGPGCSFKDNNLKLLKALSRKGIHTRRAYFHCTVALCREGKVIKTFMGKCHGLIARQLHGRQGFGYDPVFVPNGFQKTFAEISPRTKNRISHRGKALAQLKGYLKRSTRRRRWEPTKQSKARGTQGR